MIDWNSFLVVALASITGATVVVTLYALGLRLLPANGGSGSRVAAIACFAVCAAVAIFGLYLIVPAFH